MLTGDKKEVGRSSGGQAGSGEVHAELLPGDKVAKVEELLARQTGKHRLAFVGDGINDAPVLSRLMWELPWEAWVQTQPSSSGYCAYG